jgi:murein DD-endopeptidase MepM/ murein hydrolase activator NlpD
MRQWIAAIMAMLGIVFCVTMVHGLERPGSAIELLERRARDGEVVAPIILLTRAHLHDSFNEIHHGHPHHAIDIMEPRGTPVRAAVDGTIRKLHYSMAGGNTIYEFDEAGEFCYYYAHLDSYARGLREGARVKRGQIIGFVGSTGDASPDAPHLHFAIYMLGPRRQWWKGTPLDPYPVLAQAVNNQHAEEIRMRRK